MMKRAAAVWLGLLLACAGALAQEKDTYPFKLETSREGGGSVIRAQNQGAVPISLRLVLSVAENVASQPPFPIYVVIPPRTNYSVARITPADSTKAWRYSYQSRRWFGSFEARHDPAAMYRVPWMDGRTFIIGQAPGGKLHHAPAALQPGGDRRQHARGHADRRGARRRGVYRDLRARQQGCAGRVDAQQGERGARAARRRHHR